MAYENIDFDEGWRTIQAGIDKVVSLVDAGETGPQFTAAEFVSICSVVYNLKRTSAEELYSRYEAFLRCYVHTKIMPAVRDKSGELLLREVVKRWKDYKLIVHWMLRLFQHLEKFFIFRDQTPKMHNTAIYILQKTAYEEMKDEIISTVLTLIYEDREGNSVDRALIKEVLEIVYGPQSETLSETYQADFEPVLLNTSWAYYFLKVDDSHQIVEWLKEEELRAMQYMHPSTVSKMIQILNSKLGILNWSNVAKDWKIGAMSQDEITLFKVLLGLHPQHVQALIQDFG